MFVHLAALVLASAPAPAAGPAAPRYYVILFGGQSIPFQPRTAHTWAAFVKVAPTADGTLNLEHVTISWLPADRTVEPQRLRATTGKNFTLDETFGIMAKNNARVSMWGPFETDATRYALAAQQANTLESGAVRFRSLDSLGRNRDVQHCVHAVTFADPNLQWLRQPIPVRYGEPGTSKLAAKYAASGAFVGTRTHDWLLPALSLDQQSVVRREPGERVPRQWR